MTRLSPTLQFQIVALELMGPCPLDCDLVEVRRSQIRKAEALLPRTRPFSALSKGPPPRNPGDPPLRVPWPTLSPVILALLHFGTLSLHLHFAYKSSCDTWKHLAPHIPAVVDWLDLILPTNGNIAVTSTTGVYLAPNIVLVALRGLCKSGLHGEDIPGEKTWQFMARTPVLSWLLDLWLNFFDSSIYDGAIMDDCAHQTIVQLYRFSCGEYHAPSDSSSSSGRRQKGQLPYELISLLRDKSSRRNLCHISARWASALQERAESDSNAIDFFRLGCALLTVPELSPEVYPKNALRRLLQCLERHATLGHHDTLAEGLRYLETIWLVTADHRTLQWSIMEGVFTIILRVVGGELSSALAEAVTRLTRTLRQSLVFWRVLDSFRRRHDSEMSRLRRLAQDHPIIADVLTAYDARIEQFHIVEKEVVERKRRCAHDECPSPESDNTNERMRACACRSVWYCSVDCQRQHWTSEHHEKCVSGHKKRGQTASRDIHFIVELVLDYWKKNERRILDDALAIDPLRTHQLEVYIDLRPAVIDHTIRLMGQRPCEDTAWATELFAVWLDHGYTNVSCGVFEMPGEHEEAVQDEIEDEAS